MKLLPVAVLAVLLACQAVSAGTIRTAVNSNGFLRKTKFPCTQPDPPQPTFAWANPNVVPGGSVADRQTCYFTCGGYRLAAVNATASDPANPNNYLCRFDYTPPGQPTYTIYGNANNDTGNCTGNYFDGTNTVTVTRAIDDGAGYRCGCCGTINRDGRRWSTGCEQVYIVVTGSNCPPGTTFPNNPCVVDGGPGQAQSFGNVVGTGTDARCRAVGAASRTFSRLCFVINPYSGPPAPDCNKNKGH